MQKDDKEKEMFKFFMKMFAFMVGLILSFSFVFYKFFKKKTRWKHPENKPTPLEDRLLHHEKKELV